MKTLLADPVALRLQKIVNAPDHISLFVIARQASSLCPRCEFPSAKVHSRYTRRLADLPWEGISVRLHLSARKFFCQNSACKQRIFCELLPEVADPYARRTLRLNDALEVIGFALGGRPGARTSAHLGLTVSPRTLLRRVRDAAPFHLDSVRVLGVDDWAMRRGVRYGTILVDIEEHQPIDLLPDREAATLARWLRKRPGTEIVCRDRASAYADGVRTAAPAAVQVADRFHLLMNLRDALERLLGRHQTEVREAARRVSLRRARKVSGASKINAVVGATLTEAVRSPYNEQRKLENRERRVARYEAVKRLSNEGLNLSAIARQLGMHRETIRRFMRADCYPEKAPPFRKPSKVAPFDEYLRRRWAEGCYNARQLWRELRDHGYKGCLAALRRYLQPWRNLLPGELRQCQQAPSFQPPSPQRAVWWLLRPSAELETEESQYVKELCRLSPEIKVGQALAQQFQCIVRGRRLEAFDDWRESVKQSAIGEFERFSNGLMKDEAAVRAGLSSEWSSGQVEGQVNRLKMIKRQMYGRANFDLLRARVLYRG
jgi:transposase